MITLGELKHLNPRDVWADEARDFTLWLAQNLGKLGETLDAGACQERGGDSVCDAPRTLRRLAVMAAPSGVRGAAKIGRLNGRRCRH